MRRFARRFFRLIFSSPGRRRPHTLQASVVSTLGVLASMTASTSVVTKSAKAAGPLPEDAASKPHYVLSGDGTFKKFKNPHPSGDGHITPLQIFRKVVVGHLTGEWSFPDTTSSPTVEVVEPTFLPSRRASAALRATWLGHACYYVEFPSGLRVLFDPVFEDRCSPFGFVGPKRYTRPPCRLADLPAVDAVVISHSHYDHLSHASVLEVARHHPDAHFFVGLGLERWFRKAGLRHVTELDWWEDAELRVTLASAGGKRRDDGDGDDSDASEQTITARFTALPCQHTSARGIFDRDRTLWCSWAVSSGAGGAAKSVWFGGDTGYRAVPDLPRAADDWGAACAALPRNPQFGQIGALRGPFDLGLIPIGAYSPRVVMSPVHANPFDAVEIFRDTRCRRAMGIHWGTWTLTDEPVLEPPALLRTALARRGMPETGVFDVCAIGESREF